MSFTENAQLTSANGFDVSRLRYGKPVQGSVGAVSFNRINIGVQNPDGTTGPLIIPTGRLFSYGVSSNTDPQTNKITGYTFPYVYTLEMVHLLTRLSGSRRLMPSATMLRIMFSPIVNLFRSMTSRLLILRSLTPST